MPDSDIRIIATGLGFPEGPVWMADGSVILGEISGKKVTRVAPDGSKTEIGKAGGGPNGVATGPDGALYVCNNGGAVYETTPELSVDRAGARLQERLDPAHRPEDRRDPHPLHRVQRPQIVGAERPRVRQAGRVLFHRSRQALRASPRQWRALLRAAGRLQHHRAGLSDRHPERGRPVARREDRLCRRHRDLAHLRLGHRLARQGRSTSRSRRPMAAAASAACPASSASTAWRSRPTATSASRPWSPAISR